MQKPESPKLHASRRPLLMPNTYCTCTDCLDVIVSALQNKFRYWYTSFIYILFCVFHKLSKTSASTPRSRQPPTPSATQSPATRETMCASSPFVSTLSGEVSMSLTFQNLSVLPTCSIFASDFVGKQLAVGLLCQCRSDLIIRIRACTGKWCAFTMLCRKLSSSLENAV